MPPARIADDLLVWGTEIEQAAIDQALNAARLPVVVAPVALMPDAHVGLGATVGSVIATRDALIPAAVGVDIGCGMVALRTDVRRAHVPADLTPLLRRLPTVIPAGVGKGHAGATEEARRWLEKSPPPRALTPQHERKALEQFGTLGSGNHFFEVCIDEEDLVWLVLHSGSRGIGNALAQHHIDLARARSAGQALEDPNLAYFVRGDPAFDAYLADMIWAQSYAMANRTRMIEAAAGLLFEVVRRGRELERINCHHNFAQLEQHHGESLWVTRKGAIEARDGMLGIVPGSMGTTTYIVRGKGNPLSYHSCAHGAGRRMSRGQARRSISVGELRRAMQGTVWNADRAVKLIDESPGAYKDIQQVMQDQSDLVEVVHVLRQILNYKGL